jgi:hypothetical protein
MADAKLKPGNVPADAEPTPLPLVRTRGRGLRSCS